jgi:tetratricopeptide (TPR) repeat protein
VSAQEQQPPGSTPAVSFSTPPGTPGPPRRRRSSSQIVAGVLVVVAAIVGGWWWRHSTKPETRLRRGQEAVRSRDFVRAEQYAELLKDAGDEDRFHLLMGEIELRQNRWSAALGHFGQVKEDGPLHVESDVLTAHCAISLRQPRLAAELLLRVLSERPDHADALRYLASIYFDQGDLGRAVGYLEQVERLDPADARTPRLRGLIHRDREEFEEAVAAYRESLRRNPRPADEAELKVELAECLMKLRKEEEILRDLSGVETPAAQAVRAEALIGLGREPEALPILDRGLKEHPEFGGFLRLRGERYLAAGQADKAVPLLEKQVAHVPDDFRARTQLALAYDNLGRSKESKDQSDKVKEIQAVYDQIYEKYKKAHADPWDAAVREQLAELNAKIHRDGDAKMWRMAAEGARNGPPR